MKKIDKSKYSLATIGQSFKEQVKDTLIGEVNYWPEKGDQLKSTSQKNVKKLSFYDFGTFSSARKSEDKLENTEPS